ncbi:MAG: hypothetical protein LBH26_08395 [Treponema sp.]|jgi:hypothetical protein|nr:hypothetical protein [Treponema sp.]
MEKIRTIRLELRAPLFYRGDRDLVPWDAGRSGPEDPEAARLPEETEERLFCFAIDAAQGRSIEPDPGRFLGPLLAAGRSAAGSAEASGDLELPAGSYLFAQQRETLGRETFTGLAIELQKDGLWERLKLEDRLYLRFLSEEGKMLTQVFRPFRP